MHKALVAPLAVSFVLELAAPALAWRVDVAEYQPTAGPHSSVVVLPSGKPAIAYQEQQSELVWRQKVPIGWDVVTVVDRNFTACYGDYPTPAVIGPDGEPRIASACDTQYLGGDVEVQRSRRRSLVHGDPRDDPNERPRL